MRIIISGGGTGGHIYPAITIANKIKEKHPSVEILFIGTEKGMESKIIPKAGYPIKFITVSYLQRKVSIHNVKSIAKLCKGLFEAKKIIKEFKPTIVIGTGGFVCGPVLFMASKLKIKTLIHEQNVYPGITNKILERHVDRIAISFREASRHFKNKNKLVVTGNPIRSEFLDVAEKEAKEMYSSDKPLVLIVGGSGGASKINSAVVHMLKKYEPQHFKLILVTGKRFYDNTIKNIGLGGPARDHEVVPYIDDMPHALKACDLIVCSAGAITIAEITAMGKPSILIPKAYTAENHQHHNANVMASRGASLLVRECELDGDILNEKIEKILNDKKLLNSMEAASKKQAIGDATDRIYNEIRKLIRL